MSHYIATMLATYLRPSDAALARWLRRLKLVGFMPSAEAADLLRDRLAGRRRALVCSVPAFVVAAVLLVMAGQHDDPVARAASPHREWPWLLFYLWLALSTMGEIEMSCRFDKRVAARLPRRATRPVAAGAAVVLGRVVLTGIALAGVLQIVMGVLLFAQRVDLVAWTFVASSAVAWAVALAGVTRAVQRPAIAVDELTSAVDDRLRSGEAARACLPLTLALMAFGLAEGIHTNEWINLLGAVGPVLISFFINAGYERWSPPLMWRSPFAGTAGRPR